MEKEKHLVTIEFRYKSTPKSEHDSGHNKKTITIGVYDEFDKACLNGNKVLEVLESKFNLHQFPNGRKATKERFSKNGGAFGGKNSLITNLAYLKTPFQFFIKIETLKYSDINDTIDVLLILKKEYDEYENEEL